MCHVGSYDCPINAILAHMTVLCVPYWLMRLSYAYHIGSYDCLIYAILALVVLYLPETNRFHLDDPTEKLPHPRPAPRRPPLVFPVVHAPPQLTNPTFPGTNRVWSRPRSGTNPARFSQPQNGFGAEVSEGAPTYARGQPRVGRRSCSLCPCIINLLCFFNFRRARI